MKKILFLMFVVSLAFLVACGSGNDNTDGEVNDSKEVSTNDNKEVDSNDNDFLEIGEMIVVNDTLGSYELTINDIEFTTEVNGHFPGQNRDMFVVVDTTIKVLDTKETRDTRSTGDVKLDNLTEDFLAGTRDDVLMEYWAMDLEVGEETNVKRAFETSEEDLSGEEELILINGFGLSSVTEQPVWKFKISDYK